MKNTACAITNRLWLASTIRDTARFEEALRKPRQAQEHVLQQTLRLLSPTPRGEAFDFRCVTDLTTLQQTTPPTGYDALAPWIQKAQRGETRCLTRQPIRRLIPTSGSTSACKLIPYTDALQRQFNAGIRPWINDLFKRHPSLANGPMYWSISPAMDFETQEDDRLPIGFDNDTAYLGRWSQRLVQSTLAVPDSVRNLHCIEDFRHTTLWWLLQANNLRLISVWHPSFWMLLMENMESQWLQLLEDLRTGTCRSVNGQILATSSPASKQQICRLKNAQPNNWHAIWPKLEVISAWADASSAGPFEKLKTQSAGVSVEPKGVVSTEAMVSIPYQGTFPLCVASHVIELRDEQGKCHSVDCVDIGGVYEPVITTGGGLFRYATGDRVRITGRLHQTPTVRLLGRSDAVSDLCGEKLSEWQVLEAINEIFPGETRPCFVMLAPQSTAAPTSYCLWLSPDAWHKRPNAAAEIDQQLQQNPHYDWARRLGQITPLICRSIPNGATAQLLAQRSQNNRPLGADKLSALGRFSDHQTLCYLAKQTASVV